jgi:hypothetical protein
MNPDACQYLYVLSSPHGGSTLFSHVLGKHPLVQNLGEVTFLPKLLALDEPCSCGETMGTCSFWQGVFGRYAERMGIDLRQDPYAIFLGDAPKSRAGSGLIDHAYQTPFRYAHMKLRGALDTLSVLGAPSALGLRRAALPSVRPRVDNTLALYETIARTTGARILVDASKMPRKAVHLYASEPARMRIVHLTRDGRGVVASRKRYMPVSYAAKRWQHYHSLTLRVLERWVPDEHRLRVAYEQFAAQPEQTLRRVFDWLGMEYSDQCLDFGIDHIAHSAGGNPARFEMSGGIRGVDERWRTLLTAEELAAFDRIAGRLNRYLGYD